MKIFPTSEQKKRYRNKNLMSMPVRGAYRTFLQDNPGIQCSRSKFASLRPKDVILLTLQRLSTCKCPYCQTVEFIVLAINKRISMLNLELEEKEKLKLSSVYKALDIVICEKTNQFHSVQCIEMDCDSCSDTDQRLRDPFSPLLTMNLGLLKYNSWEYQDAVGNSRTNNEFVLTTKRKRTLVQ